MNKCLKLLTFLACFPLYERAYRSLMRTQWLSGKELEDLQKKKLGALLRTACRNVPYYQKVFKERGLSPRDISSIADLAKLPVLTKDLINRHFDELVAPDYPRHKLLPYATGGSTGEPTRFMHDAYEMAWAEAAVHRSYRWAGHRRGSKLLLIAGLPGEERSIISILRKLQRQRRISLFGGGEEKVREAVRLLKAFRPRVLKGYASWLDLMADYILESGTNLPASPRVISSSEKLFAEYRERIKEAFQTEPFDNYSSREFMIAAECENHEGLHIAAENLIVEIMKNGQPVGPGEMGEILITDLNRFGMPLLRYAIGDLGILTDKICPCGRGLPMIREVLGRVSDIIRTPDGKYIAAPAVAHIFKDLNVSKFRVIQETGDELIVKIVKAENYSEKDEQAIKEAFKNIRVTLQYVTEIETAGSGKKVIVQSMIKEP